MLLEIEREEISMAEMLERLRNMVMSSGELNLQVFFERARSRRELVLAFLSVLELVRTTEVKLFQRETFGDIVARVATENQWQRTTDDNNEAVEIVDEAALNEEASRELAAMVAEAESSSVVEADGESGDDEALYAPAKSGRTSCGHRGTDFRFRGAAQCESHRRRVERRPRSSKRH